MEKIEKTIRYTKLINLYSPLLSETQKDILIDYFFLDLSISEISENRGVSRAAIEDAISKGTKKLDSFEESLHVLENREKTRAKAEELLQKPDEKRAEQLIKEIIEDNK